MTWATGRLHAMDAFTIARALSFFGEALRAFAVPLLVFKLTGSASMSGLALTVEFLPKVVAPPYIGTLMQRWRLQPQFLIAEATRAVLCVTMLMMPNVVVILALSALISVCSSYCFVASESLIAVAFEGNRLTVAQARLQAADQLSRVVGSALAASLSLYVGFGAILGIASTLFLLGGIGIFSLPRTADRAPSDLHANPMQAVGRGFKAIRGSPVLWAITILLFATNFSAGVAFAVAPAMIGQVFGLSLSWFGVAASVASFATCLAMALFGRIKSLDSIRALGRCALYVVVLGMAIVAVVPNLTLFVVGYSILMTANLCFATYMRIERVGFLERRSFSETVGLMSALVMLSVPVSGALVGAVVGFTGVRAVVGLAAATTGVCVLVLVPRLRRALQDADTRYATPREEHV